jgi:outer membrane protein TolC
VRQLDLIENVVLPKAHESLDASLSAYGAGNADIVSVLDARRSLQAAELARVDAKARRLIAIAELEHAIGGAL